MTKVYGSVAGRARALWRISGWCVFFLLLPVLAGASVYYEYDAKHRLTSAVESSGVDYQYEYDKVGNRLRKNVNATATPNRPPYQPGNVSPQDNQTDIGTLAAKLQWTGGDPDADDTVRYSLYFGETAEPPFLQNGIAATSLDLPRLDPGKTYYWKVVAEDRYHMTTESPVWQFTTDPVPPFPPISPSPENGAVSGYSNVTLTWDVENSEDRTFTYDLHFGATQEPPLLATGLAQEQQQLNTLAPGREYFWRVTVIDGDGEKSEGPVWSFSTETDKLPSLNNPVFSTDTTLSKDAGPYIVSGTMTIRQGATLTIEPGTVFKMKPGASIRVEGTLSAAGTEEENIHFTSLKNDAIAGDTNQDGEATAPAPGDWRGITFAASSSAESLLKNCRVEYAGYANAQAVKIYSASPTVSNCHISKNKKYGIYVQGGAPQIEGNTIEANGDYGVYVNSGSPSLNDNQIADGVFVSGNDLGPLSGNEITLTSDRPLHLSADAVGELFSGNTLNNSGGGYVEVVGGTISKDALWKNSASLHILGNLTVQGTDGDDQVTTLNIEPGAQLRFNNGTRLTIGSNYGDPGALVATGTEDHQILLTSNAADPIPGKWYGVNFSTTAAGTSRMDYCRIEYAGYGNWGAIRVSNSSPTIANSTIIDNKAKGVHVFSGTPRVEGTTISDNGGYGLYVQNGTPVVTGNDIMDGVYVSGGAIAPFQGNDLALPDDRPLHLPADLVGTLFAGNAFVQVDPQDVIEVVGGTIAKDATWKKTIPLNILGNLTVRGTDGDDEVTSLHIEPGAQLRFNNGRRLTIGGNSGDPGALVAVGTEEDTILFTSNDADQAPGKWYGISFSTTAADSSRFEHCRIEYAGYGNWGAIRVSNSSPTIASITISDNKSHGIHVISGAPTVSDSTIMGSGKAGVYIQNGTPIIDGNQIVSSGSFSAYLYGGTPALTNNTLQDGIYTANIELSAFSGNTISFSDKGSMRVPVNFTGELFDNNTLVDVNEGNYIEVLGGTLSKDATWKATAPLHILGNITVKGTHGDDGIATLTVEPGVQLRFNNARRLSIGGNSGDPGALVAVGTEDEQILFTSNAADPAPGKWYGIDFSATAAATSRLEHCRIEYAGYGNWGAVRVRNTSPTIASTTISDNKSYGIHVISGSPTITGSTIVSSGKAGIYIQNGTPIIDGNQIINSGDYSVYLYGGTPSLTNNILKDGIYTSNNQLSAFSGNTLSFSDNGPPRVPANAAGQLFGKNTLADIDEESYIEVLGGTISRDATWKATVPLHILGNITVKGTDGNDNITTLRLQPGTTLKFGLRTRLVVGANSGDPGALRALGSEEQPVVFTTSHASPAPGKWYGLLLYTTASETSVLDHCLIEYAGYGGYGGVYSYGSAPTVSNSTIRNNSSYGIRNHNGSPIIIGNRIIGNGNYSVYSWGGEIALIDNHLDGGIRIPNQGLLAIEENTFDYADGKPLQVPADWIGELTGRNSFINTDATSFIEVVGGTVERDATWHDILPLVTMGSVTVKGTDGDDNRTTLVLQPGVSLKFGLRHKLVIGGNWGDPGTLQALGTVQKPIRFTSAAETPAPGNWYGVLIYTTSADTSRINHSIFEYAGYGGYGGVYNYGASATITNTTFQHNNSYGVRVYNGSPRIENSVFTDTGAHAIYTQGGTPTIAGNSFTDISQCGVKNATASIMVVAENNWWGHDSGPLDDTDDTDSGGLYNPTGQGACVSSNVDYQPWSQASLVDSDSDGITDTLETQTYGTDPQLFDTDGDGLGDGDELAYWQDGWNADFDNDGTINLLDADSDGDGRSDGQEISSGDDPSVSASLPTRIYEDAEDGLTTGWQVYDNDPSGAFIDNVYDADKGDRVIEFYGDGLQNGFQLQDEQGQPWNESVHQVMEWSMKYSEDFAISIAFNTTVGLRFLTYTQDEGDALGDGADIFHGLGSESRDGTWKTYIFDLGYHLQEAQPGNTITSLLGFYTSGNGRVDDIKSHSTIPQGWDSDGDGLSDNDEILSYGTHPYHSDSDGDGMDDNEEMDFWGSDWNSDPDGDGLINILDIDSDNDGVNDGI